MDTFDRVVDKYIDDVDMSKDVVTLEQLHYLESIMSVECGAMLTHYILHYGYLGMDDIEFNGINAVQLDKSDMVTQTLYLHEHFDVTLGYISFSHSMDDVYYIVDSTDMVYRFDSISNTITPTGMDLVSFIDAKFGDIA